jgi:alkanesulfonate monooxygenase SsuD/methylene tetrahydromethanopterin reductase-like flavin-dependent oxidoreductase (luciferase family)
MPGGDARNAADLAAEAERSGWDGFFVWDGIWSIDPWVSLAAAAMRTSSIRLGTMLTPLPRRKPWDVASQVATLDNLSGGRVILSVGLGADEPRWNAFEDMEPRKVRAEKLDEGLELMTLLWSGEPVTYEGKHYRSKPVDRMLPPPPLQSPRVPIWVVGLWPAPRSMRRVARWDGWLPNVMGDPNEEMPPQPNPEAIEAGAEWLANQRAALGVDQQPFDVVTEGTTTPDGSGAEQVRAFAEAGATWWLEADWSLPPAKLLEACRSRLQAGPPRI